MGWANCGTDSRGRPIGYAHRAKCDHPGCDNEIDRGLSYACGGMHGGQCLTRDDMFNDYCCESYFCGEHLRSPCLEHEDGAEYPVDVQLCLHCADKLEHDYAGSEEWRAVWPSASPAYKGQPNAALPA